MKVRRSTMLDVGVELVFHTLILFSLYLLFGGHNRPGGGFVGGLVVGGAFAMRFLNTGSPDKLLARVHPEMMLGTGLLLSVSVAVTPLALGGAIMESAYKYIDLPIWGEVGIYSVMFFDIGVYLVVLGLTSAVLESLGKGTGAVRAMQQSGSPAVSSPSVSDTEGGPT